MKLTRKRGGGGYQLILAMHILFSSFYPLILFLIISIPVHLMAQEKIWYFGDKAGIDFNTSPPTALSNSLMFAEEGSSSISDQNGNLLFYTDGITVWNRNHSIMPNGSGLLGNPSTTQGALIVPDPGNTNVFYVFSIDQLAGSNGMRYSKVDMTLHGGMGDVTTKNTLLHSSVAEKMVAVRLCDGNVWIISHEWNSNRFFADLLTPTGFNSTVNSAVGSTHSGGSQGVVNSVGYMAISQQGNRLAIAMRDASLFEVLDFNIVSGVVSNPITLNSSNYARSYGVEFSPDGTKLYGACLNSGAVYQFDLSSGNASAIISGAVQVGNFSNLAGGLKLGPDGKIYIARSVGAINGFGFLAVINNPNSLGVSCNLSPTGFNLSPKKSLLGVPNIFINQRDNQMVTISGDSAICLGDSTTLTVIGSGNIQWVQGATSNTTTLVVKPTKTTTYSLIVVNSICPDTISFTVTIEKGSPLSISASDSLICPGDSITLNVNGAGAGAVQWTGGGVSSQQTQIKVAPLTTTKYYVTGGSAKCAGRDSIVIVVRSDLSASFIQSATACGLEVSFQSNTVGADSYVWDFGDGNFGTGSKVLYSYATSGTYRVKLTVAEVRCGFSDTVSLVISVLDTTTRPQIHLPDVGRCQDGTIDFFVQNGNSRYQYSWDFGNGIQSGARNPTANYQDTGLYQVILRVTDTLCGEVYLDTALIDLDQLQSEIFIPNCFTPNGDGINELFIISGNQCGDGDVLEIYNRWGSRLYRTEKPYEEFWDGRFKGRQCTESVYYYLLFTNNKVLKGHLSLIY